MPMYMNWGDAGEPAIKGSSRESNFVGWIKVRSVQLRDSGREAVLRIEDDGAQVQGAFYRMAAGGDRMPMGPWSVRITQRGQDKPHSHDSSIALSGVLVAGVSIDQPGQMVVTLRFLNAELDGW